MLQHTRNKEEKKNIWIEITRNRKKGDAGHPEYGVPSSTVVLTAISLVYVNVTCYTVKNISVLDPVDMLKKKKRNYKKR